MSFENERWHLNGFNLCQIIVIRDGPDDKGRSFLDGRHQITVDVCETIEDARRRCDDHNAGLA